MRFLDKTSEDEFFDTLEKGITKNASFETNLQDGRLQVVSQLLTEAAEALHIAGFDSEASQVENVEKAVREDKSPEHYLQNFLQTGIMQDLTCADDAPGPDAASCSEGEEPQLSQDELKRFRALMKTEEKEHAATKEPEKPEKAEKAEEGEKADKNDIQVSKETSSGPFVAELTPEEYKSVISSPKRKRLSKFANIMKQTK